MCSQEQSDADQVIDLIIEPLPGCVPTTQGILTMLGELGHAQGFSVCASPQAYPEADWGEFLFDIIWAQNDGPTTNPDGSWNVNAHMQALVLAGESEWSTYEYVLEDFQKLLVVQATVRLMIYDEDNAGADTHEQLREHVQAYWGREPGDTFLLVARTGNGSNASLKHCRIVVDDELNANLTD